MTSCCFTFIRFNLNLRDVLDSIKTVDSALNVTMDPDLPENSTDRHIDVGTSSTVLMRLLCFPLKKKRRSHDEVLNDHCRHLVELPACKRQSTRA